MDSLTHIVIGACLGEALLPKAWGKKALVIGAIMQSLPDIDIVGSIWLTQTEDLIFHRSITHSILFAVIISWLLAFLLKNKAKQYHTSFSYLFFFFLLQVGLHEALDCCNAYGTGLLEPFSHQRFSVHLLYVADPLFTIVPFMAFLVLLFTKRENKARKKWMVAGLLVPFLYLSCIAISKRKVVNEVNDSLAKQNITTSHSIITPTTFNSLLWYVVTPVNKGYYIGYRSLFDSKSYTMPFVFYAKNDSLLNGKHTTDVNNLVTFAKDIYTVEDVGDSLSFNVLRFGQIFGWQASQPAPFAFHYFLDSSVNNSLVVQRGRFSGWSKQTVGNMLTRIKGYQ